MLLALRSNSQWTMKTRSGCSSQWKAEKSEPLTAAALNIRAAATIFFTSAACSRRKQARSRVCVFDKVQAAWARASGRCSPTRHVLTEACARPLIYGSDRKNGLYASDLIDVAADVYSKMKQGILVKYENQIRTQEPKRLNQQWHKPGGWQIAQRKRHGLI